MSEHDLANCPLAPEIQKCDRERGQTLATLTAINNVLDDLKPMIQAHQDWIQRSKGAMAMIAILSTAAGGIITTLFTWLTRK